MRALRRFTNAVAVGIRSPLAVLAALVCGLACAQTQDVAAAGGPPAAGAVPGLSGPAPAQTNAPLSELYTRSSTVEQGHTEMDESFDWGKG